MSIDEEAKVTPLMTLAKSSLQRTEGDLDHACDILAREITEDPMLHQAYVQPLVDGAVRRAVLSVIHAERQEIRRELAEARANTGTLENKERLMRLAKRNLMEIKLTTGKAMGDCDRDELIADAPKFIKPGLTMVHTGRLFLGCAAIMPAKTPMRSCLTNDEVYQVYEETEPHDV